MRHTTLALLQASLLASAVLLAGGCATTVIVAQARLEMESARTGPVVKEAAELAPQEFQHAEEERALSRAAEAHGDNTGADLHAERAVVAYERAVVLARLARATEAGEAARTTTASEEAEAQRVAAARVELRESRRRHGRRVRGRAPGDGPRPHRTGRRGPREGPPGRGALSVGRWPPALRRGPAPRARHAGRDDGRQHGPARRGGAHESDALEASLARPLGPGKAAPLDAAMRVRAACLDVLTRARRAEGGVRAEDADALLAALSAHGGWDPSRDERGVVVTLRGAFQGTALAAEAERQLRELGRVSASHTSFPVQVVVHDATTPGPAEQAADTTRARAALAALAAGGASSIATATETMGTKLPTTDPTDPQTRSRNARLEVVFVSRGD